ncbi:Hypothetical protein POVR1_LOCUS408 [uncultured virus]|nr:Hypothetical protein POVR1_LOCUS408 [uncultured virus]
MEDDKLIDLGSSDRSTNFNDCKKICEDFSFSRKVVVQGILFLMDEPILFQADEQFLDPILQQRDIFMLIGLYQSSQHNKRLIDDNLERIQRVFNLPGLLSSFREVVEAYETTIIELPFEIALPKAALYSPKLVMKVIDNHPLPFTSLNCGPEHDEDDLYYQGVERDRRSYQRIYETAGCTPTLNYLGLIGRYYPELHDYDGYYEKYYRALIKTLEDAIFRNDDKVVSILVRLFNALGSLRVNQQIEGVDPYVDQYRLVQLAERHSSQKVIDLVRSMEQM